MMQIQLSELISSEGKVKRVEAQYEADWFKTRVGNYKILEKKPMVIQLTNLGDKRILLETVIDVTLQMRCDRCLEPVQERIYTEIHREFDMKETETQRIEALNETNFISGNSLDVDIFAYSEILMNLPMKVLCSEDCKGICNRCGTNLNHGTCNCDVTELDPRMAKIRDIFKNS